jgi:hypothetical protein
VVTQVRDDAGGEITDIDAFPFHLPARDFRKSQQVIDEVRHSLRRGTNAVEVSARVSRQARSGLFDKRLTEALNGSERRTQIV